MPDKYPTPESPTPADRDIKDVLLPGDTLPTDQVIFSSGTMATEVVTPTSGPYTGAQTSRHDTPPARLTSQQLLATSALRLRDLGLQPVCLETNAAIAELHASQQFDEADELLDKTFPYGTTFYFSQAVKNARARANAAQSVKELERAEDFHDEAHDYLRWYERHGKRTKHEGDRRWIEHVAGQIAVIGDSDMFWPIAYNFARLEGIEAGLAYIQQKPVHDPTTTGLALSKLYDVAKEQDLSIPPALYKASEVTVAKMSPGMVVTRTLQQAMAESHKPQQPKRVYLPIIQAQ